MVRGLVTIGSDVHRRHTAGYHQSQHLYRIKQERLLEDRAGTSETSFLLHVEAGLLHVNQPAVRV